MSYTTLMIIVPEHIVTIPVVSSDIKPDVTPFDVAWVCFSAWVLDTFSLEILKQSLRISLSLDNLVSGQVPMLGGYKVQIKNSISF